MKINAASYIIAFISSLRGTNAFSIVQGTSPYASPKSTMLGTAINNGRTNQISLRMSDFESDFSSAMPDKPELSFQEQMSESATTFIADIESRLTEGVSPPPELEELRAARDADADASELALKIYILLIEQGMLYDSDPDTGKLAYTNFDIKANLDIPEVKQEFAYLYRYGMGLIAKGVVDIDLIKEEVKKRLIERTGLSPEEFDSWLGY